MEAVDGERCVHVGIDIGGPVGTSVHTPLAGTIHSAGYNPADGDYGNVRLLISPGIHWRQLWQSRGSNTGGGISLKVE